MALIDLPDSFPKAVTVAGASLLLWAFHDVRTSSTEVKKAAGVVDSASAAESATLGAAFDSAQAVLANPRLYSFQRDSISAATVARLEQGQRAQQQQRTHMDALNRAVADFRRALWFDGAVAAVGALLLAYGGLKWRDQHNHAAGERADAAPCA